MINLEVKRINSKSYMKIIHCITIWSYVLGFLPKENNAYIAIYILKKNGKR